MIKKNTSGFTLIEVLIGLTLISVMLVLLFASLRIGVKSWNKGESKIIEVGEMASVHNFFYNHLSSALPLWNDFDERNRSFSFQGDEESLQFVSTLPASSGRLGLQVFNIKLIDKAIIVAIKPFYLSTEGAEWKIDDVTLIENIKTLTISYFGANRKKQQPQWQSQWTYNHLPELIKIEIESNKQPYWPDIFLKLNNKDSQQERMLRLNRGNRALSRVHNEDFDLEDDDDMGGLK